MKHALSVIIHADSGVGKSWLAATTPTPRLIVDAEGGTRFLPAGTKVAWDPYTQPVPVADGTWDTAYVTATRYEALEYVTQVIESRQHPFRGISVDSLTEVQRRCVKAIAGVDQPDQRVWGEVLRKMEDYVRRLRDAVINDEHNPAEVLVFTCLSSTRGEGVGTKLKAYVQGQLVNTLPAFVDVVGYLRSEMDAQGDNVRILQVQPDGLIDAKDRTDRLGAKLIVPKDRRDYLAALQAHVYSNGGT